MRSMSIVTFALVASNAYCLPMSKRIAQTIIQAVGPWETACDNAGGGQQCNPIAVAAAETLLAAAGPCDQQNNADIMMTLSKKLNSQAMINSAKIFAQQPRNSPDSLSAPYCNQPPTNSELNGLFQCQFQGDNPTVFFNHVPVGGPNTIPQGHTAPLSPPGSCPAHPAGPIPDGQQLFNFIGNANPPSPPSPKDTATATPPTPSPATPSPSPASPGGFQHQNGVDAQKLNAQFKTLTPSSSCTAGEDACVDGKFAQCVNGAFVLTPCASGTQCFALPLVNKPGTSVTCTTQQDATTRIANTGVTGGIDGSG